MDHSTGNIYYPSGSSRIPRQRQHSNPDDENILPHLLAPFSGEQSFHPYLGAGSNEQNISVQFMPFCPSQGVTRLDSDILPRRSSFDHESLSMAVSPIMYPESSQRSTSHALSPYATDASRFNDFSSCDLATLHIVDAPLHGPHTLRRGSWPSHAHAGDLAWRQSPPRATRSPASEPPESTSDESFHDSDVDEMSPMMSQFQVPSSRSADPFQHHMYHEQALQPSVMTFQLSERRLQPVDDPENHQTLRRLLDMNIVGDDEPEVTHPTPSSISPASPSLPFRGDRLQGPGMRFQHDKEKSIGSSQYRVSVASSDTVPTPPASRPTHVRVGDQNAAGSSRQSKKSKMHQCDQCKKLFPRPSGLATHMNSHSGAKPYKCIVPNCDKSFAVRSNAKRHLRTHGINPSSPDVPSIPRYTVGFEEPVVTQVRDAGNRPSRYRWITHNPSLHDSEWGHQGLSLSTEDGHSRIGLAFQGSMSSAMSSSMSNVSDDDYERAASSSATDVHQYQGDYDGGADDYPGTYPSHGGRSPRG